MKTQALALALAVAVALVACPTPIGEPIGSEGGPCTAGGGCDPGLVCLSDLCVDPDSGEEGEGEGGEGEGEGCQGDEPATNDRSDCATIPTSSCAPLDQNAAVQTCDVAAAILRSGIFQAAFDCIADIPASACASVDAELDACFAALTACPLERADALCDQANEACVAGGDNGFPLELCKDDVRSTNQAFRDAYAECFNASGTAPCDGVHGDCYNTALNTLVGGG